MLKTCENTQAQLYKGPTPGEHITQKVHVMYFPKWMTTNEPNEVDEPNNQSTKQTM